MRETLDFEKLGRRLRRIRDDLVGLDSGPPAPTSDLDRGVVFRNPAALPAAEEPRPAGLAAPPAPERMPPVVSIEAFEAALSDIAVEIKSDAAPFEPAGKAPLAPRGTTTSAPTSAAAATPTEVEPPIHPGATLAAALAREGLSAHALALRLRVPANRITAIINGKRSITAETALRLGRFFGDGPEFWLGRQLYYDLAMARLLHGAAVEREVEAAPEP